MRLSLILFNHVASTNRSLSSFMCIHVLFRFLLERKVCIIKLSIFLGTLNKSHVNMFGTKDNKRVYNKFFILKFWYFSNNMYDIQSLLWLPPGVGMSCVKNSLMYLLTSCGYTWCTWWPLPSMYRILQLFLTYLEESTARSLCNALSPVAQIISVGALMYFLCLMLGIHMAL